MTQENNLKMVYLLPVCILFLMPLSFVNQDVSILALSLTGGVGIFYYLFVKEGARKFIKIFFISVASLIVWWPLAFFSVKGTTLFFELVLS